MRLKKCVLSVSTCALISLLNPLPVSALGMAEISQVQDVTVKGKVTDSNGETIIGANVLEKGTTNGIITDMDGNFTLKVSSGAVLEISYIGYVTQTVKVTSQTTLNIVLNEDTETLDEVVVVGYGTMKKSDLTGAVSSVKSESLKFSSSSQLDNALQGKVAGVSVITSGDPNALPQIRVRGTATLNNSDPLYVVDGFPVSDIKNINAQDIESMEVLKDASATAIYGSRGANGVILITTKKGKSQKATINLNVMAGVNTRYNLPEMCNASEYAELLLETGKYNGQPDKENMLIDAVENGTVGTNWMDEITRPGLMQKYDLSLNGGNERNTYYISGSYSDNNGLFNNTYYDKITLRLNNSYKVFEWLTFNTNLSYLNERNNWHDVNSEWGPFASAMWSDPMTPVYKEDGTYERAYYSYTNNPVRRFDEANYKKNVEDAFYGSFSLNAQITRQLNFTTSYTTRYKFKDTKYYNPVFFVANEEQNTQSSLTQDRSRDRDWVWNGFFNYIYTFGKHSINAMLGAEIQESVWSRISTTVKDVPNDENLWHISASKSSDYGLSSYQGINRLASMFIRGTYSFNNKYLLTATLRADGSSRFASHCRWGYFPSTSLGWNIKEEKFMDKLSNLSLMKIRLGYGVTGNQNSAGNYDYIAAIENAGVYSLGGSIEKGAIPLKMINKDLKWETVEMYNVGLDIGLWNNKLQLTGEYYIKNTKDMILSMPIPMYFGCLSPTANVGSVQNRGFELGINIQDYDHPLKWNIGINLSTLSNRVTSLGGREIIEDAYVEKISENLTRTEVGHEIGYFYGLKTDGIFKTEEEIQSHSKDGKLIQPNAEVGDLKFVDLNNDGIIDNLDKTKLGSAMPIFTGSINIGLEYKGFDLNANFYTELGKEIVNVNRYWTENSGMTENENQTKKYYNERFHPINNPNGTMPRMVNGDPNNNRRFSDFYVENGNFLRLQNLQIGYNLPNKIISKIGIKSLRLYLSGDNLFVLTKYEGVDPELVGLWSKATTSGIDRGQTYPRPRTYTFGLNVTF
ncbi:TonB-dependent receptor [Bacteroides sp.]|uniref:SusC/RagA family TonB-linked outer membrane protein n=1 Tax=Bacteroides sp. TaxID=29523 RepID=UPI0025831770|nr:TonB-dependent receptor [Bacteroides sp.]